MDLTDVEMFLTIVNTKSISKTAETLFLSQPTISHRLKVLEKELDFALITRSKGFKQIELTPEGTEFIPIAERMLSLWKETRLLKRSRDRVLLSVGCTDSVNVALLAPFYRELMGPDSIVDLNVRTHQSAELYSILDNHDIDVAFVFYHLYYKNIICEQVFQEKFYLMQSTQLLGVDQGLGHLPGDLSQVGRSLPALAQPVADQLLPALRLHRHHHPGPPPLAGGPELDDRARIRRLRHGPFPAHLRQRAEKPAARPVLLQNHPPLPAGHQRTGAGVF